MENSRLSQRFKLQDFYKFSKTFKKEYKDENGEPLKENVAYYITLGCIREKSVLGWKFKEPELPDVVRLIKLGNNNCEESACIEILENYLNAADAGKELPGLTGAMLNLIVDFFSNLKINSNWTKSSIELRDTYKKSLEKQENKEDDSKNEDTEKIKDEDTV